MVKNEKTCLCDDIHISASIVDVYPWVDEFDVSKTVDCSPLEITVQNLSEAGTSYAWTFGDGSDVLNVTDKQSVSHSYTNDQSNLALFELTL